MNPGGDISFVDVETLELLRCKSIIDHESSVSEEPLIRRTERRLSKIALVQSASREMLGDILDNVTKMQEVQTEELSPTDIIIFGVFTVIVPILSSLLGSSQAARILICCGHSCYYTIQVNWSIESEIRHETHGNCHGADLHSSDNYFSSRACGICGR
jgi:hypothetical protein